MASVREEVLQSIAQLRDIEQSLERAKLSISSEDRILVRAIDQELRTLHHNVRDLLSKVQSFEREMQHPVLCVVSHDLLDHVIRTLEMDGHILADDVRNYTPDGRDYVGVKISSASYMEALQRHELKLQ